MRIGTLSTSFALLLAATTANANVIETPLLVRILELGGWTLYCSGTDEKLGVCRATRGYPAADVSISIQTGGKLHASVRNICATKRDGDEAFGGARIVEGRVADSGKFVDDLASTLVYLARNCAETNSVENRDNISLIVGMLVDLEIGSHFRVCIENEQLTVESCRIGTDY